jgi:hypothetical protein
MKIRKDAISMNRYLAVHYPELTRGEQSSGRCVVSVTFNKTIRVEMRGQPQYARSLAAPLDTDLIESGISLNSDNQLGSRSTFIESVSNKRSRCYSAWWFFFVDSKSRQREQWSCLSPTSVKSNSRPEIGREHDFSEIQKSLPSTGHVEIIPHLKVNDSYFDDC